jgi:hypothetical protein
MWGTPLHTALERLPAGTTEIYFHPSEEGAGRRELEALVAPDLKERIAATGARIITFGELSEHALTA